MAVMKYKSSSSIYIYIYISRAIILFTIICNDVMICYIYDIFDDDIIRPR